MELSTILKGNVAFVGYADDFPANSNALHKLIGYKEMVKVVTIEICGDIIKIKVIGIHRLWALKREILFRKENIIQVKIADKSLRPAPIRMPGTYIPKIIAAGTYYGTKRKEFWDIDFKKEAIEIDLKNEKYTKIVVNVFNLAEVMVSLQK